MRFLRRSLVGLFLMSLTLGLLTWAGQIVYTSVQARMADEGGSRPARERVFAVSTVTFEPATITPVLRAFGEVRSRRTLELRAPAGGRIVSLSEAFEEGGRVATGDLLLQINPADAMTSMDVAKTDLTEAEAELRDTARRLELAEEDVRAAEAQLALRVQAFERQKDLAARGVNTLGATETAEIAVSTAEQSLVSRRQALAQAQGSRDLAETGLARARINLAEAERMLADTEVYAAFSGTLGAVTAVEGGLVNTNEKLAELTDPTALEVSFRVSTSQYARLLNGDGTLTRAPVRVTIDVGGLDLETTGQISRESAGVAEGQTGRLLFARLDSATGFRPGDFVTVSIEEPPLERVALIPSTAVDAGGVVLVLGAEDRLETAEVQILRRQGDDVIVRARGLAGQRLVAERSPLLGAGIKVRTLDPAATVPEAPEMLALDPERRAKLVAFVEGNTRMPAEAKERVLGQLQNEQVPAEMVTRLEQRMGG